MSEVEEAIEFILNNVGRRQRDVPQQDLKRQLEVLQTATLSGLTSSQIQTLAKTVVFTDGYDIQTRRKCLYSLIPEGKDFPYQIIPLAISSATVIGVSSSWQHAVLSWLCGLLEYGVVDAHHRYIHICYTPVFNLAFHVNLNNVACKILTHITIREDVTPNRVQSLKQLSQKPMFYNTAQILRLYHLFRPDLAVGKMGMRRTVQNVPARMKEALLAARERLQDSTQGEQVAGSDSVWQESSRTDKVNPYQRKSAIPQSQIYLYPATLEEQKKTVTYVTQYRSFKALVNGLDRHETWQWPNNPAAHLACPIVIPLFRPHHQHILVMLTNWLEFALRAEVIQGLGSAGRQRCDLLLQAVLTLVQVSDFPVPVVNHFLTEYLNKWNMSDHFDKVLQLIGCASFCSLEFLCSTLLKVGRQLLVGASLQDWCRVVTAFTSTASNWAYMAHKEAHAMLNDGAEWPQQYTMADSHLMGVWFLTQQLEQDFLAGLLRFSFHPFVLHHILDYYIKVNNTLKRLGLGLLVSPPVPFTLAVLASADLATTHRLGHLLVNLKEHMERVKAVECSGESRNMKELSLGQADSINVSVKLFFSATYAAKAFGFGGNWKKALDQFYSFDLLTNLLSSKSCQTFAAVTDALPYLPFFATQLVESKDTWTDAQREEVRSVVLAGLRQAGLTGVEQCAETFLKK